MVGSRRVCKDPKRSDIGRPPLGHHASFRTFCVTCGTPAAQGLCALVERYRRVSGTAGERANGLLARRGRIVDGTAHFPCVAQEHGQICDCSSETVVTSGNRTGEDGKSSSRVSRSASATACTAASARSAGTCSEVASVRLTPVSWCFTQIGVVAQAALGPESCDDVHTRPG